MTDKGTDSVYSAKGKARMRRATHKTVSELLNQLEYYSGLRQRLVMEHEPTGEPASGDGRHAIDAAAAKARDIAFQLLKYQLPTQGTDSGRDGDGKLAILLRAIYQARQSMSEGKKVQPLALVEAKAEQEDESNDNDDFEELDVADTGEVS